MPPGAQTSAQILPTDTKAIFKEEKGNKNISK